MKVQKKFPPPRYCRREHKMFHIVLIIAIVTILNCDRCRCWTSSPTQILQAENIKCFILFWSLHLLPFRTVTDEGAEKVPPPRYCRREHKMFHIVLIFALVTIPNRDRWRCRKSSPAQILQERTLNVSYCSDLCTCYHSEPWQMKVQKKFPHPDIAGENIKCFILFWSLQLLPFWTVTDVGAEQVPPPRYCRQRT